MNPAFWRGRKVFVTGHTGFKGSWLCLWLGALGAEVAGYSAGRPTSPCNYDLARVGEELVSIEGDVLDLGRLRGALAGHRPEVVFHLAAQPLVRRSLRDPVESYATNVLGTVHLLEAARAVDEARVVVNVTSDKCYENREWEWAYREGDPLGGRDPYSSSKACSELVTAAYRDSFFAGGAALATARAGNVIGGGDWAEDRLVPDVMRGALAGRPVAIRNPAAVRHWQHVLNSLAGYLLLAELLADDPARAGAWNFGPDERDARSVRFVAERLAELWDEEIVYEPADASALHEAADLRLDSSRARARLGWTPAWGLEEGLEKTVEWYRAFRDGVDLREFELEQIRAYEAEALRPTPAR